MAISPSIRILAAGILIAALGSISPNIIFKNTAIHTIAYADGKLAYNPDPCSTTNVQLLAAGFDPVPKIAVDNLTLNEDTGQPGVEGERQFRENFPAVLTLYDTGITYRDLQLEICYWGPPNHRLKVQSVLWMIPNGPEKFDEYLQRMPNQYPEQLAGNFGLSEHAKELVDHALLRSHITIHGTDVALMEFDGNRISEKSADVHSCWAGVHPGLEIFATGFTCDNVKILLNKILT